MFGDFAVRASTVVRVSAYAVVCCLALVGRLVQSDEPLQEQFAYFEKHVRPLLEERCLECHSERSDEVGGGLHLDSRGGWQRGGDLGPAVVPGDPQQSLLIQAVTHTHAELEMPPDGKLSAPEIAHLVHWIRVGAPDPREATPTKADSPDTRKATREHWAFQAPHAPDVPHVQDAAWPTNAIDKFILAELEQRGMAPVVLADKRTLIRRATQDLIGLPPTPAEIDAFLADYRPDAYDRLLDRLLASPRYGERWGRFWLDVARYADSNGLDENIAHGNAWRFRDYVIAAFNRDKPYDQFVREQLAGDLLPPTSDVAVGRKRTVATGFLSLGPKVLAEVDETKMEMDIIDEQVETVGRAFMALTLGCARCHDHKFDPFTTEDYYSLAGIFKSTKTMEHFTKIARWNEIDISTESQQKQQDAHAALVQSKKLAIETLKAAIEACSAEDASADQLKTKLASAERELKAIEAEAPEHAYAMAVADYEKATDLRVHIRGSFLSLGGMAPRRFPSALLPEEQSQPNFSESSSGRLQLANWLVNGEHPLVARVMVNRIWRWHFGRGLVESTDNFGQLGARPTNQMLLDWLADRFVIDGWSVKNMHRLIMQSSTYRLSTQDNASNAAHDPQNRYQWRANVRRLEAESIRDSILHVSGRLDESMGGSLLHVKNREFLFDHTSKDKTKYDSNRRSVYLPVVRNHLYDAFYLFDFSDASVMNSSRTTTTVAPQALFMMNADLVTESAKSFAARVCGRSLDDQDRIAWSYRLALGRSPTERQAERASEFLARFRSADVTGSIGNLSSDPPPEWVYLCQTLLMSNEFIHIH